MAITDYQGSDGKRYKLFASTTPMTHAVLHIKDSQGVECRVVARFPAPRSWYLTRRTGDRELTFYLTIP